MFGRKFFHILAIFLICATLKMDKNKSADGRKMAKHTQQLQQNFHDVDAFGDDFIDFGAQTGPKGQFSW
jgi:hypothetical protein